MTTKMNELWQAPEGGVTKQKDIQKKIGPIILFALITDQQDESKEKLELPNVIVCRRYSSDRQNDMTALHSQLPEILENITYLSNPGEVTKHLKSDKKNIIFVGQYFDYSMTGTEVATAVKKTGLNAEVSLITSIDVPYSQRSDCDYFYQINSKMNQSDGANVIVRHLKNKIKVPVDEVKEVSSKDLLEAKLELLHKCLIPSQVPDQTPKILSDFSEAFDEFKNIAKDYTDAYDKTYVSALAKLRDILLKDL